MNSVLKTLVIAGSVLAAPLAVFSQSDASGSYQMTLAEGDELRSAGKSDEALAKYVTAVDLAQTGNEVALAHAKQAHVLAYDKDEYLKAIEEAETALSSGEAGAIAKVIALEAKATSQMKGVGDFEAAIASLEEARDIGGVDWAQPSILNRLGDCYRTTGRFQEALDAYSAVCTYENADKGVLAVAWLNKGITYQYNLSNPEAARDAYKQSVEVNPGLKDEIDAHLIKLP